MRTPLTFDTSHRFELETEQSEGRGISIYGYELVPMRAAQLGGEKRRRTKTFSKKMNFPQNWNCLGPLLVLEFGSILLKKDLPPPPRQLLRVAAAAETATTSVVGDNCWQIFDE
jgi:hypothetical protein